MVITYVLNILTLAYLDPSEKILHQLLLLLHRLPHDDALGAQSAQLDALVD